MYSQQQQQPSESAVSIIERVREREWLLSAAASIIASSVVVVADFIALVAPSAFHEDHRIWHGV